VLYPLSNDPLDFPSVDHALSEPNGLLAFGGDLSITRLVAAYQQGIFPWYSENDPILWWSPDPRAIINTNQLKINRTLSKFLRKMSFTVTLNKAFEPVINFCSNAPFRKDGTWILPDMKRAYLKLHQAGFAHSIEVWQQNKLVGGLYGVASQGFFSGESMFYIKSNASKVALIYLAEYLKTANIDFIDCQLNNDFLASMGCYNVDRDKFMHLKNSALNIALPHDFWQAKTLTFTF
jgi:leucyl/phenylalanyl-tRNA--protein transferase